MGLSKRQGPIRGRGVALEWKKAGFVRGSGQVSVREKGRGLCGERGVFLEGSSKGWLSSVPGVLFPSNAHPPTLPLLPESLNSAGPAGLIKVWDSLCRRILHSPP